MYKVAPNILNLAAGNKVTTILQCKQEYDVKGYYQYFYEIERLYCLTPPKLDDIEENHQGITGVF